tara:strand:+ start:1589 stop:3109 length:1521 start_codon:yes stop_codon:yes gene_type:complete
MSSGFVNMTESKVTDSSGKNLNVPVYMQFVPGQVIAAITSEAHPFARSSAGSAYKENVGSIIAFPYYTSKIKRRYQIIANGNHDKYRYFPLLRGMYEVPSKGDPVLLCTIGGQNFYLGPLNTNNSPNWNPDLLFNKMHPVEKEELSSYGPNNKITPEGSNRSFMKQNRYRLQKFPDRYGSTLGYRNLDNPAMNDGINDINGDMMLEGRHGNSIRIGSRAVNPYIFISNGIQSGNKSETLKDGSTIALISKGRLSQHFGKVNEVLPGKTNPINGDHLFVAFNKFVLSSDYSNQSTRNIGDTLQLNRIGDDTYNSHDHIYSYAEDQILLNSHRIILNSKKDNIYLSAAKSISIGCQENLNLISNNDIILNTKNTYIGSRAKIQRYHELLPEDDENKNKDLAPAEPLVLGRELKIVLDELIDCLSSACYVTMAGAAIPIVDSKYVPLTEDNPELPELKDKGGRKGLGTIKDKLILIQSKFHFIENNEEEKDPPPAGEGEGETTTGGTVV